MLVRQNGQVLLGIAYLIAPNFKGGSYIGNFEEQGVLYNSINALTLFRILATVSDILVYLDKVNCDSRSLSYYVTTG